MADEKARTTGKLTKPEDQAKFVERVASAMETASQALLDTATRLRADPKGMLGQAYSPAMIGAIFPQRVAKVEAVVYENGLVRVNGTTIIDGSKFNELAFSARWEKGDVTSVPDNHIAV